MTWNKIVEVNKFMEFACIVFFRKSIIDIDKKNPQTNCIKGFLNKARNEGT